MYNVSVGGLINRGECITFSPIPTKLTGEQVMSMKTCSIPGCNDKHKAKSYCEKHYRKLSKKHRTTECNTWQGMRNRCNNPNDTQYINYGGRGVAICDRWNNSFKDFLEDMGHKPFKGAQIDRIDNNGNYEPGNCKWVTAAENNQNRRNNVLNWYTVKSIRKLYLKHKYTFKELSKIYEIAESTLRDVVYNKSWKGDL